MGGDHRTRIQRRQAANLSASDVPQHIAYLTGEYPRATDTFIQREVAALRRQGLKISTLSIRKTSAAHLVGPEQQSEAAQTHYVLRKFRSPLQMLRAFFNAVSKPARLAETLSLTLRSKPPGLKAAFRQCAYLSEAIVVADILKRQKITHLHNHIATSSATVAMLASRLSGIPYSFTLHGPDIFFAPHYWRLDQKISNASFVACISQFCKSQAMAFSSPRDWHKLQIVHCGVEPNRYERRKIRNATTQVLFVGRLAPVKGVKVLIDALACLTKAGQDLHLTIVGDGPDRSALEKLTKKRGLQKQITFTGYQSQTAVAEHLANTDIFALPSFAEGVPVVLMEAMAAGTPVIATSIAGIPELVTHGQNGLLVPPGDKVALVDAITALAADPAMRASMGALGHQTVRHAFNCEIEARYLAAHFKAVANRSGFSPRIAIDPPTTLQAAE